MKKLTRILQFSLLALAVASFASVVHAADTELEKAMQTIGKNTKELKHTVGDPAKKTEALAELGQMIKGAELAKTLTPKKAAEIPEAQRSQFVTDFHKQIDMLLAQFRKIEADVTAGRTDDAKSEYDKLNGIKRAGHEKFAAKG